MLNARLKNILQELMAAKAPLTSEYLANVIQVTSRTIRNDMKEVEAVIRNYGAKIKSIRGKGYELQVVDEQTFRNILTELIDASAQTSIPTSREDRVRYIMNLLFLKNDYVKLEEIADEMFISLSTLQNDLKQVKQLLQVYGISLQKRPNYGVKLVGDEVKMRYCMSEHLLNRKQPELDILHGASILPSREITVIREIILEQITNNDITLSDIALHNLLVHLAISCKRIKDGNQVSLIPDEVKSIKEQKEYCVAEKIVHKIEQYLSIIFPPHEIAYVAIHLLGTKTVSHRMISEQEMHTYIDDETQVLCENILDNIDAKLSLGIKEDKELFVALCLHLKPAVNRYRYGMNLRNPILDAIKKNDPLAFEAGIEAALVIKEHLGMDIDENEIGYLALHIGGAMERSKVVKQPKKCMIICASGVGSATLLFYKLKLAFGEQLQVVGTTEYYKLADIPFKTLDFLISTIPIKQQCPIPVIEVSAFLGNEDIQKIDQMFHNQSNSLQYTREELVFLMKRFESKEAVLSFLCEELYTLGLISNTFIDSVLEREAISPTAFGNFVAVPHPMTPETDETFWAICTLEKPIQWGSQQVQFICLLSIEKESTANMKDMYAMLIKLVDDQQMVQQLLKCRTYTAFIDTFIKKVNH